MKDKLTWAFFTIIVVTIIAIGTNMYFAVINKDNLSVIIGLIALNLIFILSLVMSTVKIEAVKR